MKQFFVFTILLLFLSCSSSKISGVADNPVGGTSIEVSSFVKGIAVTVDRKPIENLSISIYPIQQMSDSTIRDGQGDNVMAYNGEFSSEIAFRGPVGIEIKDQNGNGAFRGCTVLNSDTTIDLDTIVLEELGMIRIILDTSKLVNSEIDRWNFTTWCGELGYADYPDSNFTTSFLEIPQGEYTFSISAGINNLVTNNIILDCDTTVKIIPGEQKDVIVQLHNLNKEALAPELQQDLTVVRQLLQLNNWKLESDPFFDSNITTKRLGIGIKNNRISSLRILYNLDTIPDFISELRALESLIIANQIKGESFTSLPESISNLEKLHTLHLFACHDLLSLPESIGYSPNLQEISLTKCSRIGTLPESLMDLLSLQTFSISWQHRFTELPSILYELQHIPNLFFDFAWIPSESEKKWMLKNNFHYNQVGFENHLNFLYEKYHLSIEGMRDLEILKELYKLNNKEFNLTFYDRDYYVRLKNGRVNELVLHTDTLTQELWQLTQLDTLEIINSEYFKPCKYFKTISSEIGLLRNLKKLHIRCDSLESLPNTLKDLENLEELEILTSADKFPTFPEVLYELRPEVKVIFWFRWIPSQREKDWALQHMFQGNIYYFEYWLEELQNTYGTSIHKE